MVKQNTQKLFKCSKRYQNYTKGASNLPKSNLGIIVKALTDIKQNSYLPYVKILLLRKQPMHC